MSHFCVVVIGPDPEQQLAKYNENEPGPARWEPVRHYDIEEAERGLGITALANPALEHLEHLLAWMKENDSDEEYSIQDGEICRKTTYNKFSKWDGYSVGGRWTGFFPLKKGKRGKKGEPGLMTKQATGQVADQAKKGAIDFEGARAGARERAEKDWIAWEAILLEHGIPRNWNDVRGSYSNAEIDKARDVYHVQGAVQASRELVGYMTDPVEHFGTDKAAFVQRQVDVTLTPYAMVRNGEWVERGTIGWFCMSSGDMAKEDWSVIVNKMYDETPDDTLLTLIDAHI